MEVYEFDREKNIWKEKKAESNSSITKSMEGQWLNFEFGQLQLQKDLDYAFRISCAGGGMVAIAECPWSQMNPYADGEEWIGSSQQTTGYFHKDFDLAFEAQIEV